MLCAPSVWLIATGLLVGAWALPTATVRGDVVLLESGGRLVGDWLNPHRQLDDPYELELVGGGKITLSAELVRDVQRQTAYEMDYEQLAPTFADTADGQWDAAEWCREHELKRLREHHLRRLIELRPDHAKAWIALGYTQVNGQWKRRKEVAEENGYRFHQGKWRLEQEITLVEARQRLAAQRLDWRHRIMKWVELTYGTDRSALEARQQLAAIRDPVAIPALVQALVSDRRPAFRLFLVEVLNRIDSPDALQAVLKTTLLELHPEVVHGAIDRVVRRKTPWIVEFYCKALEDQNNLVVNRAAYVLGRLDDHSSVGPLIKALQTRHVIVRRPPSGAPAGQMTALIPKDDRSAALLGGPQLSTAPEPVAQWVVASNEEVHAALLKITAVDFGYHTEAWKRWHATWNAHRTPQLDARRAP